MSLKAYVVRLRKPKDVDLLKDYITALNGEGWLEYVYRVTGPVRGRRVGWGGSLVGQIKKGDLWAALTIDRAQEDDQEICNILPMADCDIPKDKQHLYVDLYCKRLECFELDSKHCIAGMEIPRVKDVTEENWTRKVKNLLKRLKDAL